jgi:HD superfamily phosphohydrolase
MPKSRVVRDPIYGYVRVPRVLEAMVDHALVQRLRRVGQTSMTSSVYPSATGGRFEHALGTMHLAQMAWEAILANSDDRALRELRKAIAKEARALRPGVAIPEDPIEFAESAGDALAAAALLHDVGHPPFSHVLEPFFATLADSWLGLEEQQMWESVWAGQFHEAAGTLLARKVLELVSEDRRIIAELILRSDPDDYSLGAGVLHSVLASEIDIDRIDYLMRDAQRAGTEFGAVDYRRLIEALEIRLIGSHFRVAPSARARSAVETLLVQRAQSYKWIIYHHRVVGANEALARAVRLASELSDARSTARLFGAERNIGELFAAHRPALNYLQPSLNDVRRTTGITLDELGSQRERNVMSGLSEPLQAGIDDGTVLEWLKAASTTARLLLAEAGPEPDVKDRLQELVVFVDVALLRRRRMFSAWKTIEDFRAVADSLVQEHDIGAYLVAECDAAVGQASVKGVQRILQYRDQLERTLVAADGDRIRGMNALLQIFLSHSQWRRALDGALQARASRVQGVRGVWATGYTGFRAIRTRGQLASIWQPPQREPAAIRETSPLVAALEEAEAARPRLYAYFFLLEGDPAPALLDVQLRLEFTRGFAGFLREQWQPFLADVGEE